MITGLDDAPADDPGTDGAEAPLFETGAESTEDNRSDDIAASKEKRRSSLKRKSRPKSKNSRKTQQKAKAAIEQTEKTTKTTRTTSFKLNIELTKIVDEEYDVVSAERLPDAEALDVKKVRFIWRWFSVIFTFLYRGC